MLPPPPKKKKSLFSRQAKGLFTRHLKLLCKSKTQEAIDQVIIGSQWKPLANEAPHRPIRISKRVAVNLADPEWRGFIASKNPRIRSRKASTSNPKRMWFKGFVYRKPSRHLAFWGVLPASVHEMFSWVFGGAESWGWIGCLARKAPSEYEQPPRKHHKDS